MTGKGPLNYTTTVDPQKTMSECITILARYGATAIAMTYDNGMPGGLHFQVNTAFGRRNYALPANVAGTHEVLMKAWRAGKIPPSKATLEQAQRTSWRVIKMWLEAQLALIEAGLVDLPQVMLPFMIDDEGRTVYQRFLENEQLALTAGGAS
jgi:hypothetical protein